MNSSYEITFLGKKRPEERDNLIFKKEIIGNDENLGTKLVNLLIVILIVILTFLIFNSSFNTRVS